jgi:hypothetical protein
MDTNGLKGRIAEVLVEGIFRRAGYQTALVGRENGTQSPAQTGPAGLTPHVLVWKQGAEDRSVPPLRRLVALEVRYQADVERALSRQIGTLSKASAEWHDLYGIFVTDRPTAGRACFQVVDPRRCRLETPSVTMDLHELSDLDISWKAVEEYERLVKLTFPVLSGAPRTRGAPRRPEARPVRRLVPAHA